MDQRLQYEKLIAGKLQQLPVPDIEDAIWQRVKMQLDLDMPEDDGPGSGNGTKPGPGIIGSGLAVLLIALITIFILFKKQPVNSTDSNSNTTSFPPGRQQEPTGLPPGTINRTVVNPVEIGPFSNKQSSDSLHQQQSGAELFPVIDSANTLALPTLVTIQPSPADTVPVTNKKSRGVQGINADDYRIVPKKDSTGKQ